MNRTDKVGGQLPASRRLLDQFGNIFWIKDELKKGGQGVVLRTTDRDIAIKQPIDRDTGNLNIDPSLPRLYARIRTLPLPKDSHVTMPLSILKDEPGYVMRLLDGMRPLGDVFAFSGTDLKKLDQEKLPAWLANVKDRGAALQLLHYARTGGARERMEALFQSASLLARLHLKGIVYGDVSPNNVFIGRNSEEDYACLEAWLIDVDNLRLECSSGGGWTFTKPYGAPELNRGQSPCSTRTDIWSFAVMAYELLTTANPFDGRMVREAEDDGEDWALEGDPDAEMSLEEQSHAGFLPYVHDPEDDSNGYVGGGLPLEMVSTESLRRLFLETLGAGRTAPHRRPNLSLWALELARAYDLSLTCPGCGMSYLAREMSICPFCDRPRPAFVIARAGNGWWEKVLFDDGSPVHPLPHRLFYPFSLAHCADVEYAAEVDFASGSVRPGRGWRAFPLDMKFEFVSACDDGKEAVQ